jgi:gliding motility-associated-like protein
MTILTPDTSICAGNSVVFNVTSSGATGFSWTPGSSLSNANIAEPTATPTVTTTYILTATGSTAACPNVVRSVTISVGSFADSILTPDTAICAGSSFQLRVWSTPGAVFSWSPSTGLSSSVTAQPLVTAASTATYVLTTSLPGSGCPPQTKSVTVNVQHLTLTMPTPDTSVCLGYPVTLGAQTGPGYTYSWSPAAGLNLDNVQNPVATTDITTTYVVTVDSPGSICPALTGSETIHIIAPFTALAKSDTTPCVKGPISLHALPGGTLYQYYWTGPNGFSSTSQNPFIDTPGLANQGEYILVVTDIATGCHSKDSVPVTLAQDVAVELTNVTQTTTIKLGESVQLNADSALYYTWFPDNGSLSNANINDPVARPTVSTTYFVVGINQYGCRDTDSVHVEVLFDPIFIPSAFSPNQDGLNDMFRVGNLGYYTLVQMSLYDRWGELIFEDNSGSNRGWDGNYKGKPMEMGTFYYYIIVRRPDEKQVTYKGDVTLLR